MGFPHDKVVSVSQEASPNLYQTTEVPKQSSLFESYVLQSTKETGLCFVKGIGTDIATDDFGSRIKSEFDGLEELLERKYGPSTDEYDFVRVGSLWDDPQDFMMVLLKNERYLASVWDNEDGANLPNNLEMLTVYASAISTDEGYLSVEYYFRNYDEFEQIIKNRKSDVL